MTPQLASSTTNSNSNSNSNSQLSPLIRRSRPIFLPNSILQPHSKTRMAKAARLVLLPAPGVGHLKPAIEMAKRLSNHFSITILVMQPPTDAWSSTINSIVSSAASTSIQFLDLPPINFSFDETTGDLLAVLCRYIESHKPLVKDAIANLPSTPRIAAIIIDFIATVMIDVAAELGIPPYLLAPLSAANVGLLLYLPTLNLMYPSGMASVASKGEMIKIPSLTSSLPPLAMPEPILNKECEGYQWVLYHARRFQEAKGILINTFSELETHALRAISEGRCVLDGPTPAVYAIGPVVSAAGKQLEGGHDECIQWLDGQPEGSVVFLCFGSMGCFEREQVGEIAMGLERSQHRFLWCLRTPPKRKHQPSCDADLGTVLPEGFLERTKGRGMVWPGWAPQVEILGHKAVGGFVSHCGWNSCLESLVAGVPILGWPLYSEQRFNAFEMAREVGVATEIRVGEGGVLAGAEEVERGVRCLMGEDEEGRKVKEKAREVKELSRRALEEGGSARLALDDLVKEFVKKIESMPN